MDKERIIYRPNCFASEAWERLSRDEQIAYCKSLIPKRSGPPPGPLHHLERYERGVATALEFISEVLKSITGQNVAELDRLPLDRQREVAGSVAELPADDDDAGWGQVLSVSGSSYEPWVTAEEIRQMEKEDSRRCRDGVRVFRAHRLEGSRSG